MTIALTVMPVPKMQFFDNNGDPLNGGFLYAYASGTSTPAITYSDYTGTQNTWPVQLDSAGRAVIFVAASTFKYTLTKSDGTILWTVDGVPSTGLSQSIVGIGATAFQFGGAEWSPITNTSYATGTTADKWLANSSSFTIDSALLVGTFGLSAMIEGRSGVTVTLGLMNLSDGSPNTPISTISGNSTTGATVTGTAISFATAGVAKTYAVKPLVASGSGFCWNAVLTRLT